MTNGIDDTGTDFDTTAQRTVDPTEATTMRIIFLPSCPEDTRKEVKSRILSTLNSHRNQFVVTEREELSSVVVTSWREGGVRLNKITPFHKAIDDLIKDSKGQITVILYEDTIVSKNALYAQD